MPSVSALSVPSASPATFGGRPSSAGCALMSSSEMLIRRTLGRSSYHCESDAPTGRERPELSAPDEATGRMKQTGCGGWAARHGRPWNNPGMTARLEELVAEGRAALRAGDAAGARRALEQAVGASGVGDVIEGLARASYLELDYVTAIDGWERAYAAHRDAGDHVGAVRVARSLAYMYWRSSATVRSSAAGWLARADAARRHDRVDGGAAGSRSTSRMFEGDRARKEERLPRGARASPGSFGDTDLEFVDARLPRGEPRPRRPHRGGHDAARRGARGGGGQRGRRLLRARGDLLPALRGVRARARRRTRRPVDPDRRGDRRAAAASGGLRVLPHALRRRAHRGRTVAGGRRGADRGRAPVGPRSAVVVAQRRPRPPRRPARPAGPVRGGRAAARRPRRHCRRRGRPPARRDPSGEGRHVARRRRARARPRPGRPAEHGGGAAAGAAGRRPPRRRTRLDEAAVAAEQLATCAAVPPERLPHGGRPRWPAAGCASRPAPATRRRASARRSPASPGRRCRWRWRTPGSSSPTRCSPNVPKWRWPRLEPRSTAFERLQAARHVDAAAAVLRTLGVRTDGQARARAADQARGRGARAARPRAVEPRDLRPALHQPQDRRAPRRQRPRQARAAQPGRGRRVRRPAPNQATE